MKLAILDTVLARLCIQIIAKPQAPSIPESVLLAEVAESDLTPLGRLNAIPSVESLHNLVYAGDRPCLRDLAGGFTLRDPESALRQPKVQRAICTMLLQKPLAELHHLCAVELGFYRGQLLSTRNASAAKGRGVVNVVTYDVPPMTEEMVHSVLQNSRGAIAERFR